MQFQILGPLQVVDDGRPVHLGRPKQRTLLAVLLVEADRAVSLDQLVEQLWNGQPPAQAIGSLQAYVSNLRRVLEPGRGPGSPPRTLLSQPPGYRLAVADGDLDVHLFEASAADGHRLLEAQRPEEASTVLRQGLSLWRGPVLVDFPDEPFVQPARARLEQLRLTAMEDRITADLALGHHTAVIPELEQLVATHPFQERLQGLLLLGLYRAGRQGDALRAYQAACSTLRDELGISPGPRLRRLHDLVLQQSAELDWSPPRVAVERRTGARAQPRSAGEGLVGRDEQLATAGALLAEAAAGHGRVVLVTGEPGIGKTRLTEAVAARAGDVGGQVGWGRCWEGSGAPVMWPWVQVVRALFAGLPPGGPGRVPEPLAAELAPLLPELADRHSGARAVAPNLDAARFRLYEAVCEALRQAAAERPFVVILEDLHWADPPSLQLLTYLAGEVTSTRVLVLATYRDIGAQNDALTDALAALARRPAVERMALGGLGAGDVTRLMAAETGLEPDRRLAGLLHDRTGGNPFFVVELLRLLAGEGRLRGDDAEAVLARQIPVTVRDVLRRRLATLPEQAVSALLVGAVAGPRFDLETVQAVTSLDDDEILGAVEAALLSGLVVEDDDGVGHYRFGHALVREAIYDDMSRARRARLHARIGQVLQAAGAPGHRRVSDLAHHMWQAASVLGAPTVLPHVLAAADGALTTLAYEEAELQLRRALQLTVSLPSTLDRSRSELQLHLRLGAVLAQLHGPTQPGTADAFTRSLELAAEVSDDSAAFTALRGLHEAYTAEGSHRRAEELAEQLLAVAARLDDRGLRAAAHMTLGRTLYIRGRFQDARRHMERSLELAETAPALPPWPVPLSISARILHAAVLELVGEDEAAAEAVDQALLISARHSPFAQATALAMSAHVAVLGRDPRTSGERARAALSLATTWHIGAVQGYARAVLGWVQAVQGDPDGAIPVLRHGLEAIRSSGARLMLPTMLSLAAEAELLAGRAQEALSLLDDARECVERTDERFTEAELYRLRGQALAALTPARTADAEVAFRASRTIARRQGAEPAVRRATEDLGRLRLSSRPSAPRPRAPVDLAGGPRRASRTPPPARARGC
ncbi:BTAD domain-containing putative transcriptional regulator [Geodermatophilus sp. SYSU D00705]